MKNMRDICKKLKCVGAGVEVRLAHHLTKVIGLIPVLSCGAPSTQGRHDTQYNDTSMAYTRTSESGVENWSLSLLIRYQYAYVCLSLTENLNSIRATIHF